MSTNINLDYEVVPHDVDQGSSSAGSSLKNRKDDRKDSSFFSLKEEDAKDCDADYEDFTPIDGIDNFSFKF